MTISSFDKHIYFKLSPENGIDAIYLNTLLRRFAFSLITVFIPIFLFTKGKEVIGDSFENGMSFVLFYFLVWAIVKCFSLFPTTQLISRFGYRYVITISNVFWMALLTLFYYSEVNPLAIWFAPVVHAIATSLYWLSYFSIFTEDGHINHIGKEMGTTHLVGLIASILGPITGGVIIDKLGFPSLFLIALVITSVSGIPFFLLPKHKVKETVGFGDVINWLKQKYHRNEITSFVGRLIDEKVADNFWPIYVFIIVGSYAKQGVMASFVLTTGVFAVYMAGKLMDNRGNKKRFIFGVVITALTWILRIFVRSFNQIFLIDTTSSLATPFYWVNYESLQIKDAKKHKENVLVYNTARLLVSGLATIFLTAVAFFLVNTPLLFPIMFVLGAIGAVMGYSIWEDKNEK